MATGSGLAIAKVTKAHPEANAVDIVYVDSGAAVPLVQVMGHIDISDLPEPSPPDDAAHPLRVTKKRDVYAVVGSVDGIPLVMGFLKPQVHRNLFKDRPNFRVAEHPSGAYSTLDDTGAMTLSWPNGSYLKVGEDPANEDLSGKDFDAKWAAPDRNTDRAMHARFVLKSGGAQKALIDVDPDGNLTLTLAGGATVQVAGNASVAVTGSVTSSAAQWNHTGDLHVDGDVRATGTVTGDTDVKTGAISLKNHPHNVPGVQSGSSTVTSDPPH